jgi:hypothetical protein
MLEGLATRLHCERTTGETPDLLTQNPVGVALSWDVLPIGLINLMGLRDSQQTTVVTHLFRGAKLGAEKCLLGPFHTDLAWLRAELHHLTKDFRHRSNLVISDDYSK